MRSPVGTTQPGTRQLMQNVSYRTHMVSHLSDCNFLSRVLFKYCYWLFACFYL